MPKNPFGSFSDEIDSGFEQNSAVQSTTHAAKNAASHTVKQAGKAVSDATKSFVDMLYGVSTPTVDPDSPDGGTTPPAHNQQSAPSQHANGQQTPEQAKIDDARKELHQMHKQNHASQFTLESELQRARQQRVEAEKQRLQQEEEEKQQHAQAAESGMQDLSQPEGKKSGMQNQRKKKSSIVLSRVKTKAETNRGTSG